MFLISSISIYDILENIPDYIENHSVFAGIITSVIVSSMWLKKFLKQKRAEAFFGFYAKLSFYLNSLQTLLEENGRLNISDPKSGNIYSLIYIKDFIKEVCPNFVEVTDKELELYKKAAKNIKHILLETDNNVYPTGAKREKWYESQRILFSFCEFLENDEYKYVTNIDIARGESETKHILKCKALVQSIRYIQYSINHAKY